MESYQVCKRSTGRIIPDLLQCTPCPPPMVNYCEFLAHALARNLSQVDVSNIARRCRYADADMEDNCYQNTGGTTTITTAAPSSFPITDYSTPSFDSNPQTRHSICDYVCLVIIVSTVLAIIVFIMIIVVAHVLIRRRRAGQPKKDDVGEYGNVSHCSDTKVTNDKAEYRECNTAVSYNTDRCNVKLQTEGTPNPNGEEQRPDSVHKSECPETNAASRQIEERYPEAFSDNDTTVIQNKGSECISRQDNEENRKK